MIMWAISSKQKKGLRQGDPLSPIVFNLVANMLALLVSRAREDNQIKGVVPHLVDGGLSIHWNMQMPPFFSYKMTLSKQKV